MLTSQGIALIAELVAAAWLVVALLGLAHRRSTPWLVVSALAFVVLLAAVTMLVDAST